MSFRCNGCGITAEIRVPSKTIPTRLHETGLNSGQIAEEGKFCPTCAPVAEEAARELRRQVAARTPLFSRPTTIESEAQRLERLNGGRIW